jgi:glycosyltransferase involved in cell wall biosynthesis
VYHRLAALTAPSLVVLTTCLTSRGSPDPLHRRLESWAYRTSDRVLTNSEAGREFLIRSEGVSPTGIRLVPQGIDFSAFDCLPPRMEARARLGLPAEAVVALFLGWFRPEKNLGLLVEAAARLRSVHPRLHWCLVGEGVEGESLGRRIDDENLGDVISLPGRREDLAEVFAAADLFVLSSNYEGLPGALLEALGAGLPAVVTRVGDCRDLVEGSGAGLSASPGDSEAFAGRVAELAADPELRRRMGRRGKRETRRRFGVEAMVRETQRVYEEALLG